MRHNQENHDSRFRGKRAAPAEALVSRLRIAVGIMPDGTPGRDLTLGICNVRSARQWEIYSTRSEPAAILALKQWTPDAIVVASPQCCQSAYAVAPIVVSLHHDLSASGTPSVLVDDHQVGRVAAAHLIDKGLKRLAVFEPEPHEFVAMRAQGVADVCAERGAEYLGIGSPRLDLMRARNRHRVARMRVQEWVRQLPTPCGVLVGCDVWAPMLAFNITACGLDIPSDIAMVGVDDDETRCEMLPVPLSSARIPWRQMGIKIATLIESAARGERTEPGPFYFQSPGVRERPSSNQLAVQDPDVRQALTMIRQCIDQPLTVKEILDHLPINRRRLERLFVRHLGRTIHQETRRLHVEQAKQLLIGTDLSMPMVARRSGFSNATMLGIGFRQETKLTPTEYRRKFRRDQ